MKDIHSLFHEVQWKLKKHPLLSPRVGKVYCWFHCLFAGDWMWLTRIEAGWWLWRLPRLQLRLGGAWGTPLRRTEGSCEPLRWLLLQPRGQWLRGTREKWRGVAHMGRHCPSTASEGQNLHGQMWPWGERSRGREALLKLWRGDKAWTPRHGVRWVGAGLQADGGRPPPSGADVAGGGGEPERKSSPPPPAARRTCWDEKPAAPAVDQRSPGLPPSSGTSPLPLSTLWIQCSWSPWQEHVRQSSLKGGMGRVGDRRERAREKWSLLRVTTNYDPLCPSEDLSRMTTLRTLPAIYGCNFRTS